MFRTKLDSKWIAMIPNGFFFRIVCRQDIICINKKSLCDTDFENIFQNNNFNESYDSKYKKSKNEFENSCFYL